MKKICACLAAVLLCLYVMPAQASFGREDYYALGLSALEEMKWQQAEQAEHCFDLAGTYLEAKNYKQYALSLSEILREDEGGTADLNMTAYRLSILAGEESFALSLAENGFPSCGGLIDYISARKLETDEEYGTAWHTYAGIRDVLDSFDRQLALTEKAYEEGRSAYRRGDYKKAAQVLEGLNWQASEYLYHNAVLIPKSQQFDVRWNVYRQNWDILLNGVTLSSDMAAMKERLDQALAMEGMADEGKTVWLWWAVHSWISFHGVLFFDAYVYRAPDGRNWLILEVLVTSGSEESVTAVELLHDSLREHHYVGYTSVDGETEYFSLNASEPEDLDALLDNNDNFSLIYTFHGENWDTRIDVVYSKNEKNDTLQVWIPLDRENVYEIGNHVFFGSYPQTEEGTDDTPIEWQVLDIRDGKALLVSRYALDCRAYHVSDEQVTWKNSSLRKWLNGEFYTAAFSASERRKIARVNIIADDNPQYDTDPGKDMWDKVFLLSAAEAEKYLVREDRVCGVTKYAEQRGAWTRNINHLDQIAAGYWWLRTSGSSSLKSAGVASSGEIDYSGRYVSDHSRVVRPAIWVQINADP